MHNLIITFCHSFLESFEASRLYSTSQYSRSCVELQSGFNSCSANGEFCRFADNLSKHFGPRSGSTESYHGPDVFISSP